MAEWTHNICERDWFASPRFSAHESGGFRQPNRVILADGNGDDHNDICCVCGVPTVSAIYVRADPNTLLCKGDHETPDKWSPFLGVPMTSDAEAAFAAGVRDAQQALRDDDYTPEAMDRTEP